MHSKYEYEYRTASHLGRRITRRVYATHSDATLSIRKTNARRRIYGQMTLDGGRVVSHELMTRYFRMLRHKLESSQKIR